MRPINVSELYITFASCYSTASVKHCPGLKSHLRSKVPKLTILSGLDFSTSLGILSCIFIRLTGITQAECNRQNRWGGEEASPLVDPQSCSLALGRFFVIKE